MIKCGRLASKNATARLTTTRTNTIGYIYMYVRVIGTYVVSEKRAYRAPWNTNRILRWKYPFYPSINIDNDNIVINFSVFINYWFFC